MTGVVQFVGMLVALYLVLWAAASVLRWVMDDEKDDDSNFGAWM